ncbi:type II restriction endonuclease [Frondihabitans sucicola]|uniref:site-specific DNA-methyltransferase (adenine-specific) n=1 Tax=Frondihabitans sucicola TaxID=1268041 RepID=A0ABN6XX69_9MICO|nr:DEAD/DEAH box helicase family protein [Frondihabitans sucicola]BDZ48256.1 type II restriction endonuclease [Frondihabitans sucicola]
MRRTRTSIFGTRRPCSLNEPAEGRPDEVLEIQVTQTIGEEMLVKSRARVKAHGEVFTPRLMVDQMLDLVSNDLDLVDTTFFEPAAGDGNFLIAILQRKLTAIEQRMERELWPRESLFAVASIYGVELLEDNHQDAKAAMLKEFRSFHARHDVPCDPDTNLMRAAAFLIDANVICGNTLTGLDWLGEEITFSWWVREERAPSIVVRERFTLSLCVLALPLQTCSTCSSNPTSTPPVLSTMSMKKREPVASPKISTFREVTPLIYSWRTPDIPKYEGWEKIGYTEQETADKRIAQQASQLGITKEKLWAYQAVFVTEDGGRFRDSDFHAFLRQRGVQRELSPRTEWHKFAGAPKTSDEFFSDFSKKKFFAEETAAAPEDYELRPEQHEAVAQAIKAFGPTVGASEALWNAKPRFGKTLTTYDLMRKMDVKRVLIVTNRPAVANAWFDDYQRFLAHQTTFKFVSESPSLAGRTQMTREQWRSYAREHLDEDPRIIEFVSLQDLKGSQYFGGNHPKLKHIAEFDWDLLVIDEAHEGIDTTKTDVAFNQIKRAHTLHLSGTPFKALASGKFDQDQIFNWTYEDEQTAKASWRDAPDHLAQDSPYAQLPTLNLLTYQVSRMVTDRLAEGVALDEEDENVDYTFDLAEFFSTKANGFFTYEADVVRFLDALATNDKYPFSTPELRNEIRHSFWLLNRVASAKALEKLLKRHDVFSEYTVILAAGDGRPHASDDNGLEEDADDLSAVGKSLDKVRTAIAKAEGQGGRTITLSVGQLTTGVTVPEWTAVIMLSNLASPALYMQAAFRSQNPFTFVRGNRVLQKKNAYIFDFAPERTLAIFDAFANNLAPTPAVDVDQRKENIKRLLNFFPILGEDAEGRMVELDAEQVLSFPRVFRAREVVRRGFLSNLLFANVAGIFRAVEHFKDILDQLPVVKEKQVVKATPIDMSEPLPTTDRDGKVLLDTETVINPKVAQLGKPVYSTGDMPDIDPITVKESEAARRIAAVVTEKARPTRDAVAAEYGMTAKQVEADEKATEGLVKARVERAYVEHQIAVHHIHDEAEGAATEADSDKAQAKIGDAKLEFDAKVLDILHGTLDTLTETVVRREETKKLQKQVDKTLGDARDHLRGFARTIPMFLMAYGDRNITLSNFDDYTPDDVFAEIAGISEDEFRKLRDGRDIIDPETGETAHVPGLFDAAVFDQSIQEFLNKKAHLADYSDPTLTEDIFAYIPQQKTSLVFTPKPVVQMMCDALEAENEGIFSDPDKTFADLFSTAGLFCMEIVRRLDAGLVDTLPDREERLRHILTCQVFEMSHNEILHSITVEAVSGGVPERRAWIEESGHFRVGDLARMSGTDRQNVVDEMLGDN